MDTMDKTPLEVYAEKKTENHRIANLYTFLSQLKTENAESKKRYAKKAAEIKNCSSYVLEYMDKRETPPILRYQAFYCHNRFCPLCIYKTAKQYFKLVIDICNHEKAKNCSYLFMTLTIRNCKDSELSDTITHLLDAYTKLIKDNKRQFSKRFLGTLKTLECTYNKRTRTYHPHLHILVMIDKTYFTDTKKYLTKSKLIEVWQNALSVDYKPSVDIRATYNTNANTVAEVSKYSVKSSEIENAFILRAYDKAFFKRRLKSFTGLFREIRNDILEQWRAEKKTASFSEIQANSNFIKNLYKWNFFNSQFELIEKNINAKEAENAENLEMIDLDFFDDD